MSFKNPIIPENQTFYEVQAPKEPDLRAICTFSALGFFLEDDTFHLHRKVMKPCTIYETDDKNHVISKSPWFQWTYEPRNISIEQATEEFADILHKLIAPYKEQNKKIILPISGGLDSRTQAVSLKGYHNVNAYSYSFQNGIDENYYGRKISEALEFPFREYRIREGYIWDKIDRMAAINGCYSDFTHPRQMAIEHDLPHLGDIIYLGHWGDVLFDNFGLPERMTEDELVDLLMHKIVKKGGLQIASDLWRLWHIPGNFETYLRDRLRNLLREIDIDNANAKIRAFKSLHWATRWTAVSLSFFKASRPVFVPYFSEEMCRFITTVPEDLLKNRQIQMRYIQQFAPALAEIEWQDVRPLNINNAHLANSFPHKLRQLFRIATNKLSGNKIITRNWELQFQGDDNMHELETHLMHPSNDLIPREFYRKYLRAFSNKNPVMYSHPVSMLLNISKVKLND